MAKKIILAMLSKLLPCNMSWQSVLLSLFEMPFSVKHLIPNVFSHKSDTEFFK
jgi:hypothetical protein